MAIHSQRLRTQPLANASHVFAGNLQGWTPSVLITAFDWVFELVRDTSLRNQLGDTQQSNGQVAKADIKE